MRIWHRVTFAGVAATVVTLSALVPVWATTPPSVSDDDTKLVPVDLFGLLIEKCQQPIPVVGDQTVFPNWVDSGNGEPVRVRMELWLLDEQGNVLSPPEPTDEQAMLIAAANECLEPYAIQEFLVPPQFDGFHRNMYYDYVARALVPCLDARGVDPQVPPLETFGSFDVNAWYVRTHLRGLDFDEALGVWQSCPPIPAYLDGAGQPQRAG